MFLWLMERLEWAMERIAVPALLVGYIVMLAAALFSGIWWGQLAAIFLIGCWILKL